MTTGLLVQFGETRMMRYGERSSRNSYTNTNSKNRQTDRSLCQYCTELCL